METIRNLFKYVLKRTIIFGIDIVHYFSDIYDYYLRPHLKQLRAPRENDYTVCYLIYDKISSSQTLIRAKDYTYDRMIRDVNDPTVLVVLSFIRNQITTNTDMVPPSTPRSTEADRLYCVVDQTTLKYYFIKNEPSLEKIRNSISEDIMYAGLKVGETEYDIYEHLKKYMIKGNRIDRDVLKQMMNIYYPTYPKTGILHLMNTSFEEIYHDSSFLIRIE